MALRPVFIPRGSESPGFVEDVLVEFEWSPGFAVSQKQKSIRGLHRAAAQLGLTPVLEVSTKSSDPLGVRLSAFNLEIAAGSGEITSVEGAFQGSKVFESGGPYRDLYGAEGRAIKRDDRLRNSGPLRSFDWNGVAWPLEPTTAFYDWLYLRALDHAKVGDRLLGFAGFTDIEFNPAKSLNCQARSCALYVSLQERGLLPEALAATPDQFRRILSTNGDGTQRPLF